MRSKLLKETLTALFPIQRTVCIEGPPGGGKSTIVREVAQSLGVSYIEVHMPTMLVEDFGIPYKTTNEKGTEELQYVIPSWFPQDPEWEGILCFDDRNQASADLQKTLANICQARNLHGHPLPKKCMVVSTGNRQSDKAGSNKVLSHLRNRETVVELETNLDDWMAWANTHGVKSEVLAFVKFRPDLLHNAEAMIKKGEELFATPRSWTEGVNAALGIVPHAAEFECFKGAVGAGPATEFKGFLKIYRELPDVDDVIKNPDNHNCPEEAATRYALAAAISNRLDEKNLKSGVKFLSKMPGEFSVLALSMAVRRNPKIANSEAFSQWSIKHQNVLF